MALDPIISAGIAAPQLKSQDNLLAERLKSLQAQSDYDKGQRDVQEQNALRDYYRSKDPSSPDFGRGLYGIDPAHGMAYDKAKVDNANKQSDTLKNQTAVRDSDFKLASERQTNFRMVMGSYIGRPDLNKAMVIEEMKNQAQQGLISPQVYQNAFDRLPEEPGALRAAMQSGLLAEMKPADLVAHFNAKPVEVSDGQNKFFRDVNQNSPTANQRLGESIQLRASPEARLTDARTRSEGDKNRYLTQRGQDITSRGQTLTDTRERQKTSQEDRKLAAGEVSKIKDANDVLSLLDMVEKVDPATGKSILGTATSSTIGNIVDQGAKLVGASTDGSEAAAQARAVEGALIAKMPKMSGPQSDKDVLLYRQMAGEIGDPTVPEANKRAAAKVIREINSRHAGGDSSKLAAAPVKVTRREEVQALPSGSRFVGPDGVVRIKP